MNREEFLRGRVQAENQLNEQINAHNDGFLRFLARIELAERRQPRPSLTQIRREIASHGAEFGVHIMTLRQNIRDYKEMLNREVRTRRAQRERFEGELGRSAQELNTVNGSLAIERGRIQALVNQVAHLEAQEQRLTARLEAQEQNVVASPYIGGQLSVGYRKAWKNVEIKTCIASKVEGVYNTKNRINLMIDIGANSPIRGNGIFGETNFIYGNSLVSLGYNYFDQMTYSGVSAEVRLPNQLMRNLSLPEANIGVHILTPITGKRSTFRETWRQSQVSILPKLLGKTNARSSLQTSVVVKPAALVRAKNQNSRVTNTTKLQEFRLQPTPQPTSSPPTGGHFAQIGLIAVITLGLFYALWTTYHTK